MAAKKKKTEDSGPKKKTIYTLKLNEAQMQKLDDLLNLRDWEPYEVDYAQFAFKGERVNVVGYTSGKLVIQGKNTEDFVQNILEAEITGEPRLGYEEFYNPEYYEPHAGVDESGKGDLFGPLVSATVIADGDMVRTWVEAGLQDSKKIADTKILKLEKLIKETDGAVAKVSFCGMARYNELMGKPKANLNLLLAWLHGKSLNAALDEWAVPWGMVDQFSKKPLTQKHVKDREGFELKMQTKAEADPVVAAASVIARAEFLRQMKKLNDLTGESLLKGAGAGVKQQAIDIFERGGRELLRQVAKMHFKTAYEAQGLAPPEKPGWAPY